MKDWELLSIVGSGIILGLVLENNKNILKRITHFTPSPSQIPKPAPSIIPISTTTPTSTQPDLATGKCPPGMYLDKTRGIYRCRSAGHIRALSPNVKSIAPDYGVAWGLDEEDDYAYPPLIPPGGPILPAPAPVPQILPGPITPETHPSRIKESENKRIEAQKKREEERKKKREEERKKKREEERKKKREEERKKKREEERKKKREREKEAHDEKVKKDLQERLKKVPRTH